MKRICFLFGVVTAISGLGIRGVYAQALPAAQGQPTKPPVQIPAPTATPQPAFESFIAFDAGQKDVTVSNGTPAANFIFNLTNISSDDVVINYVQTSCGCTVAKLPTQPWKLAPKESGQISATMQLAGTPPGGSKTKTLTVSSNKGNKALYVKATIQPLPPAMSETDRLNNQKLAMADRQAIFKNADCVKCHVDTAKDATGHDKMGKDLYAAVCGVCHDAQHQASFVPNLHRLPVPTNQQFWDDWISHGKPGTLMPAFAKSEGGILSDDQIKSLIVYLVATIPPGPTVQNTIPTRTAIR